MTTPIDGTSGTGTTTSTSSGGIAAGMDGDAFMKLLLAQLKYQNPMSPTDPSQSMSQLASFTQVEKLGQLVTAQTQALALQERMSAAAAIGQQASGTDADGAAVSGVVKGVSYLHEVPVLELTDGSRINLTNVQHLGAAAG